MRNSVAGSVGGVGDSGTGTSAGMGIGPGAGPGTGTSAGIGIGAGTINISGYSHAVHGYGADVNVITLGEVIANDGSFDQTNHDKVAAILAARVAALSVQPIVNFIKTITGEKSYDQADWETMTESCKKGNFIMGLVDERGQLQAYFDQNQAYVKGSNPSGNYSGTNINNFVSLLKAKIPSIETNIEHPMLIELIWDGLLIGGSYIRHFIANKPNSNISTTSKAVELPGILSVLPTGEFKFNKSSKYAGVKVKIPGTSFNLIGAKEIPGPGSVGQTVTVTGEDSGLAVNPIFSSVNPGTDQGFVPSGKGTFEGGSQDLGPVTVTVGDGPANQGGKEVKSGITLWDVFSAGTVESASHVATRASLLRSVAGLSASLIVNLVGTLGGQRDFDQADWFQLGAACKEGMFDLGLLDAAGKVQAMFQSDGKAYVNAINPAGSAGWVNLNPSTTTTFVEAPGQPLRETPQETEGRLGSIAKEAKTPLGVSNFMGTDIGYNQYATPTVLENRQIKFGQPAWYAGITATIPGSTNKIVAAQMIKL